MSRRLSILTAIVARLEQIQIANEFETDAGLRVFLGEAPALGPDDPDQAIAVLVGDDVPTYQGEHVLVALPIQIAAVAKADLDAPWVIVEQLISDIKKAIELEDRTLGGRVKRQIKRGSTRTLPRESGSTKVGVTVEYSAPYTELWGAP
jgi:hypothetical protein